MHGWSATAIIRTLKSPKPPSSSSESMPHRARRHKDTDEERWRRRGCGSDNQELKFAWIRIPLHQVVQLFNFSFMGITSQCRGTNHPQPSTPAQEHQGTAAGLGENRRGHGGWRSGSDDSGWTGCHGSPPLPGGDPRPPSPSLSQASSSPNLYPQSSDQPSSELLTRVSWQY